MPFTYTTNVRFGDTDALGHVNNARFLSYMEDARIAFMRSYAPSLPKAGMILAHADIDFLRPIFHDGRPVEVDVVVSDIGTSSIHLRHELRQGGAQVARAAVVLVAYDYAAERPRPVTDTERAALEATRLP